MLTLKKIPVRKVDKSKMLGMTDDMPSYPPSFHISSKQMPEISDWKVKGKYRLVVDVEMKSINAGDHGASAGFDITAYAVMKEKTGTGKSIDDMTDKEFGEYQGKALSKR